MANGGGNPSVTIAGAGVAGLTAAHRLLERGYDVTLIEANSFIGGKLAAHQDRDETANAAEETEDETASSARSCPACKDRGGCLRSDDWHEHCYHMYLNWYHNFWQLMEEIGVLSNFSPMSAVYNMHRSAREPAIPVVNVGSPWTTLTNLFAGVGTPADMFLWGQTLADLVGQPAHRDSWLERTSITAFMKSQPYTTDQALAGTYRTTAQAFASPSYLSSARSYKALLSYGLRLPEPSMWLLTANTEDAIFTPWLKCLAQLSKSFEVERHEFFQPTGAFEAAVAARTGKCGQGGRLTIKMLTQLQALSIDDQTGRVTNATVGRCRASPSVHRGSTHVVRSSERLEIDGDLILALPLTQLGSLVTPKIADRAPDLVNVRYLRCEPMISIDLFFKKKLDGLSKGITVLLNSPYEMSFFDNSQNWTNLHGGNTVLNVVASNADTLTPHEYSNRTIIDTLLRELRRYIDFERDDLFDCRTHLQTNLGEELSVNQVGSWQWRPTATCGIPNLYIAGDYCRSFVDVVTIEGAAVSGLIAAEALRRRRGRGSPIRILEPDQYPVVATAGLAMAQRPFAFLAWAFSVADDAVKSQYSQWFPNG
jgi:predicted NAD/FAD-dependent oxidoreductase